MLVTALDGAEDKVRGLDAGADDFLTKPVNQTELIARVRSMIRLKRLHEEIMLKVKITRNSDKAGDRKKSVILIVEDNEKILKNYRLTLDSEGHEVMTATKGSDAISMLDRTAPDLILLDVMLPDMDGMELLRRIKANVMWAEVPVVIISVIDDLDIKVRGFEEGVDDYLVKPVDTQEMLARVRAVLRRKEMSNRLKADMDAVFERSITDALTGLHNLRYLTTVMEQGIAYSQRYAPAFSVMMIDIDHFKDINDTYGHPAGDGVLKELGVILKQSTRESDIAIRYGGEEFVVILHNAVMKDAMVLAETLRETVERHRFQELKDGRLTISIGVSEFHREDATIDSVIKRADKALYEAKEQGRNMVKEAM